MLPLRPPCRSLARGKKAGALSFKTRQQWGSIGTLILERLLGQETPSPTAATSMQRLYPENGVVIQHIAMTLNRMGRWTHEGVLGYPKRER
jgi:hypothetical protein